MALCPGDTTQWEDIHRRLGNFAQKPKEATTDQIERLAVDVAERFDPLADKSLAELDRLEDDVEEDELERYRRQRLAQLKAARSAAKFGEVRQVRRQDFVAEVTEASADGQWVLVLLFVESSPACQHLMAQWDGAARRFPSVKFLKGVAREVVPDFPDSKTPTVLIYRNRDCHKQVVGIDEWGGRRCDLDIVEWVLAKEGVVETDQEEDPRQMPAQMWQRSSRGQRDESDEDSDKEKWRDDRGYASTRLDGVTRRM